MKHIAAWLEWLRWELLGLSDWFAERGLWRTSIAIGRLVLAMYRAFRRCVEASGDQTGERKA